MTKEVNCMNCMIGKFKDDLCDEKICKSFKGIGNSDDFVNSIMLARWIPCSERLPSVDGDAYLVTDYCPQINRRRIHIAYCYANKDGFWSDTPKGYEVLAWMPLPKPYREEGEE